MGGLLLVNLELVAVSEDRSSARDNLIGEIVRSQSQWTASSTTKE